MQKYWKPDIHPQANSANCICGDSYRITLLTEKLVRLEYDAEGRFEDRATQVVWNRNFPPVPYTIRRDAHGITIRTSRLNIVYDEKPFSANRACHYAARI